MERNAVSYTYMFSGPQTERRFYAVAPDDDIAQVAPGSAIPTGYGNRRTGGRSAGAGAGSVARWAAPELVVAALLLVATLGFFASQLVSLPSTPAAVAAPTVVIEHSNTGERTQLQYGTEPLLSQPDFFAETHAAFVADETTFIEADLAAMELRYYEDGVEQLAFPIQGKGRSGSWWETPAGLYEVRDKREKHFSTFGNVNLPWSMPFQGNFFIHGIPEYPDGTLVDSSFSGGCIRLATADAKALFARVGVGTPVLVHEPAIETSDFQYEPNIPEMDAPHYLLADIGNNTILASSDLNVPAPIASITKLMTALIAVEHINLDKRVAVTGSNFVQSIIPRLANRHRVSMYSLLQLLLMESSNEAAELIAGQIGRDRFITLMNEKATAIGMHNTTYADPSGLSNDNVSTLNDLLRLAQYLHSNRSFVLELTADQYVPTAYASDEFGELNNFNPVADLDNFYGGKVGETDAAGKTSLSLHRISVQGQERIIAIVVLGSNDRTADVRQLEQHFTDRFVD